MSWAAIWRTNCSMRRARASVVRNTKETPHHVASISTACADRRRTPAWASSTTCWSRSASTAASRWSCECDGDPHIDEHHTIEDSALALGQALKQALGDKRGIGRYGFTLPMDESQASAALDLSGRPYFVFEGRFPRERVGEMPTELVPHFFRSLCDALGAKLHLSVHGDNAHHMVEACFKGVARALRQAIRREGSELPSTKGML